MRFYTSYTNRRHNSYGAGTLAGYDVHTRGWDAGVRVTPREAGPDGKQDDFDVYMTTGSHESGHNVHLGTVHGTADRPVWEAAAPPEVRTGNGELISKPTGPTDEDHGMARHALQLALNALEGVGCCFWACAGPDAPFEDMKTCNRCSGIQDLRAELARITR